MSCYNKGWSRSSRSGWPRYNSKPQDSPMFERFPRILYHSCDLAKRKQEILKAGLIPGKKAKIKWQTPQLLHYYATMERQHEKGSTDFYPMCLDLEVLVSLTHLEWGYPGYLVGTMDFPLCDPKKKHLQKRKVFSFHETILSFGEPGSLEKWGLLFHSI